MSPEATAPDAVGMDDLTAGEDVLLVFVSHFNEDATQTVKGVVESSGSSPVEMYIDGDDGEQYRYHWEGGVERRRDSGVYLGYGGEATLYRLTEVGPMLDDGTEEP